MEKKLNFAGKHKKVSSRIMLLALCKLAIKSHLEVRGSHSKSSLPIDLKKTSNNKLVLNISYCLENRLQ